MSNGSVKLNRGVRINSGINARRVAESMGNKKSTAAAIAKGGYSIFGTNLLYTPANRINGYNPKYMNASQLSTAWNVNTRMPAVIAYAPVSGSNGITYSQNIEQKTSWADYVMAGMSMVNSVFGVLNTIGVFNSSNKTKSTSSKQGASNSNQLETSSNQLAGNPGNVDTSIQGSTGIENASTFGTNFGNEYASISNGLDGNNPDYAALQQQASSLVTNANKELSNAKANYGILQERKVEADKNVEEYKTSFETATKDLETKKGNVDNTKSNLDGSKKTRSKAETNVRNKYTEYDNACDGLVTAENAQSSAQDNVNNCQSDYNDAQAAYNQAHNNSIAATNAYNKVMADPNASDADKAAAKDAMDKAKDAEDKAAKKQTDAKSSLVEANKALTTAKDAVTTARGKKSVALSAATEAHKILENEAANLTRLEKQVEDNQAAYDAAIDAQNVAQTNYDAAKANLEDANGVIAQTNEYQTKIGELEQNQQNATELQEEVKNNSENANSTKDLNSTNTDNSTTSTTNNETSPKIEE